MNPAAATSPGENRPAFVPEMIIDDCIKALFR